MATSVKAAPRRFALNSPSGSPQTANRQTNFLSIHQRPVVTSFDDDGPGTQSPSGPRHNNDHVLIKDIQILPTTDEILCTDRPYMPRKNLAEPHCLVNGPLRHFDTLFRHLRFDSTEAIRDICYHAAQNLVSSTNDGVESFQPRRETASGKRYFAYEGIKLEEVNTHEKKGLITRLSYSCPEFMRGRLMYNSGRLEEGMLCALVCLDENSLELSVVFMEISQRQSTQSMDSLGGLSMRAAVELSFPPSAPYNDVLTISRMAQGLSSPGLVLVELPGVLYAGFYWTLLRLQQMLPSDVAFLEYIAPGLNGPALLNSLTATNAGMRKTFQCNPPLYAQLPGFAYELEPISSQPASFTLNQIRGNSNHFAAFLQQNTNLDNGQVVAFLQNLTREFAFTQGPPGTGKTFLGIALARTLLASRAGRPDKPLMVVCQTNHALDNFLAGLRDAGVEKLVRIGSNSKEEWTKAINLREKSSKLWMPLQQFEDKNGALRYKQALFSDIDSWCKGLNAERITRNISWHAIDRHLEVYHPDIRRQFVTAADNKRTESFTFDYWSAGGDLQNLKDLQMELSLRLLAQENKKNARLGSPPDVEQVLADLAQEAQRRSKAAGNKSLWLMPLDERKTLLRSWNQAVNREELAEQLATMHFDFHNAIDRLRGFWDRKDAAALLEADVIGMTTTASATRWDMLKMLNLETLICEEAAELLEAHSLCSLLPTLEHAIFIGDPLQLRPEISEQSMSLETLVGGSYRLDESIFERFMLPIDPAVRRMPTSQLNMQRRMHPDIANITRLIYPALIDHDSTSLHAKVAGVTTRMFWLDHQIPEMEPINGSKSYINSHEVEMVAGLVRYLLTRNTYSLGDIAVITPYNDQLAALVESLQTTCAIWLSLKDRETLLENGILPEESENLTGQKEDISMSNFLRVATVDNFQGEEAKIIILSTVRSGGRPGFLKTANRVNVACSRARDGFYVVGNSQTLHQVPYWSKIVNIFAQHDSIGPAIRLACDRHPHHYSDIARPLDFARFQDCQIPCGELLNCNHICFYPCHDLVAHHRIPCRKPCAKLLPDCSHKCTRMCFEKCGTCQHRVGEQLLACGHLVAKVCGGYTPKCLVVVRKETLPCSHVVNVRCFEEDEDLTCHQLCAVRIPCDHKCTGTCKDCFPEGKHPPCEELCNRELPCSHRCPLQCHGQSPCEVKCNQACLEECAHGPCKNLCNRMCDPCVKPYTGEEHVNQNGPRMICSVGRIINQPQKFEDVFDRLLAKMGRKLDRFGAAIAAKDLDLRKTLSPLLRSIRPNPLAAKANKSKLTARGTELRSLITDIVNFREDVIDIFEESMISLPQFVPGIADYTLLFRVRFDILEYRARSALILDTFNVARQLMLLEDSSNEVQRQAEVLQTVAVQDCLNCIERCQASLIRCKAISPCAQVELLLQEVHFNLLAEQFVTSTTAIGERIAELLDAAILLCRQYPSTAGAFLENVGRFRNYTKTNDPNAIPFVTSAKSREMEKRWGHHAVGHLTTCGSKHPYSSATFLHGCPECGNKVELEEEIYERTKVFLKEDDFLKAMNIK